MTIRPPFGHRMRDTHFQFSPSYTPLNHGSFGAYPRPIQQAQDAFQKQCTERPDTFYVYDLPELVDKSREAVAPLLGADPKEVVLIPNATTGVNTVLRNLKWEEGDMIVYFSTIYDACEKTIESVREMLGVEVATHCQVLEFPINEESQLGEFKEFVELVQTMGTKVKLAIFDTVRLPQYYKWSHFKLSVVLTLPLMYFFSASYFTLIADHDYLTMLITGPDIPRYSYALGEASTNM